jgi:hypothetical protein
MSKTYQIVRQIRVQRNFRAGLLRMDEGGTNSNAPPSLQISQKARRHPTGGPFAFPITVSTIQEDHTTHRRATANMGRLGTSEPSRL